MRSLGRLLDRDPAVGDPATAFYHALFVSRFATTRWLVAVVGLAIGGAYLWTVVGLAAGLALGLAVAGVMAVAIAGLDRPQWRAQDVYAWHEADRDRRWREDTGGPAPTHEPAEAEIWLGAHPRGTVPQLYRAIAARRSGDAAALQAELVKLPAMTSGEVAWKAWLPVAWSLETTGSADVERLRPLVDDLPDDDDRRQLEAFLAVAESLRRHRNHEDRWLEPLAVRWPSARRVPLGLIRRTRIWLGRFSVVAVYLVTMTVLGASGLGQEQVPAAYAETSYAVRGEVAGIDEEAVYRSLPAVARAVAGGTRLSAAALDAADFNALIDGSLPTFFWQTSAITLAPPADVAGRRVWSIEVLLGAPGATAILVLDRQDGPAYAYRVDPAAISALRRAFGVQE